MSDSEEERDLYFDDHQPFSASASETDDPEGQDEDDDDHDDDDEENDLHHGHDQPYHNGGGDYAAHRPPLSQNFFAPPFYGRPPTPLPPSPSLTSLLRPSRPTTPDASDSDPEQPGTVARASPRVPTYEYYGFVLYLFSSLTFLVYLLWAYLPSPFLHALGIFYYPDRWWALAVPAYIVMLIVYIFVALASYNVEYLTLPLGSLETVVDDAGQVAVVDPKTGRLRSGSARARIAAAAVAAAASQHRNPPRPTASGGGEPLRRIAEHKARAIDWRTVWNVGTDAVMDVPLAGVNEVLYGYHSSGDEDDVNYA
ncbi:PIG-P-domain-containing protein [Xylariales sp. PMI_506]|nr:PIG-P-domain-containing protein [Xylariales sp. PMI_506]